MTAFGYTLLGEEHGPNELVTVAKRAEEAGFDFVVASDHYHPWVPEQQHSPYVWSVLGAVATVTEQVELATMVTCPTVRYHPAIVAQKAATVDLLSHGRFTLGLGAGELLNEHVVGDGWPPVDVRHNMLEEAIGICRLLWLGGYRSYRGDHYTVDDARVFDLPERPIPIAVAASGPAAATLAGRVADGLIAVAPDHDLVEKFRLAGGDGQPAWGQIPVSWNEDAQTALSVAHERFRWSALGWKAMSELPNPVNFDSATAALTPEVLAGRIPHGPNPDDHLEAIRQFTESGFNRIALYQIGDDQEGFMRFWEQELRPRLDEVSPVAAATGTPAS